LIASDSRPALWVLVSIYHELLKQIEQHKYEVFAQRISVSTSTKLWILSRGLIQVLFNRLRAGK
jgi:15-cis-phytoene synthase